MHGRIRSKRCLSDSWVGYKASHLTLTSAVVMVEIGPGTESKAKFGDDLLATLFKTSTVLCVAPEVTVKLHDSLLLSEALRQSPCAKRQIL